MMGGVRRSNSWLHGWAGLLLGWLMFAIFLTGTISFFRQEVTFWMQPELHRASGTTPVDAAQLGLARLASVAPDARRWTVNLPSERNPTLRVSWDQRRGGDRMGRDGGGGNGERRAIRERGEGREGGRGGRREGERQEADGSSARAGEVLPDRAAAAAEAQATRANARGGRPRQPELVLDPLTGETLRPRETAGGEFLYRFHYQLYALPRDWGRLLVGIATLMMFVALLSGIVTHKKIFRDFFTFRPGKGQRSWLDAHNATAVLSLPFHLMITFSGLLLLGGTLLPWGQDGGHGRGEQRIEQADEQSRGGRGRGEAREAPPAVPVRAILAGAERTWGSPAGRLTIERRRGAAQSVEVAIQRNDSLLLRPGGGPGRTLRFDPRDGRLLDRTDTLAANPVEATDRTLAALHLARFAPWDLRWLFFAGGVMGTAMVGTGMVLWAVKRAEKRRDAVTPFGHRLVEATNVAAIAGLTIAVAAYFWANRLLPATAAGRPDQEILVFFLVWALAIAHPVLRSSRRAWIEQLGVAGVLFATIPLLNAATGGASLPAAVSAGNWLVAGFDAICLTTGAMLLLAARRLSRPRGARPAKGPHIAAVAQPVPAE